MSGLAAVGQPKFASYDQRFDAERMGMRAHLDERRPLALKDFIKPLRACATFKRCE